MDLTNKDIGMFGEKVDIGGNISYMQLSTLGYQSPFYYIIARQISTNGDFI